MREPSLFPYLILALLLHAALIAGIWWFDSQTAKPKALPEVVLTDVPKAMAAIPTAVAVDEKKVEALVKQIRSRKEKEAAERRRLQKEIERLRRKRAAELKKAREAARKRALEEKRKKQAERERQRKEREAKLAKQKAEEARKKALEAQKRLEAERLAREKAEREAQLAAQLEAEQKRLAEETARQQRQKQIESELKRYQALIQAKIERAWIGGSYARLKIRVSPGGLVIDIQCLEGEPAACRDATVAVRKAEPLPVSDDPDVFRMLREIFITLRPETKG
ncbi:MAG: cell envelope integrity protein TolA [Gammaproteobacteria bacterium]|nr:MAG: cell envelope integrity protein TolA [Gammaproteobacteria bacterium]